MAAVCVLAVLSPSPSPSQHYHRWRLCGPAALSTRDAPSAVAGAQGPVRKDSIQTACSHMLTKTLLTSRLQQYNREPERGEQERDRKLIAYH